MVGSVVVAAVVVVGAVTDVVLRVIGVSVVGLSGDEPPVSSLTSPKRINAISAAPTAPNATSATGFAIPGKRFRRRWASLTGRRVRPLAIVAEVALIGLITVVGVPGRLLIGMVGVVRRSVARHGH